MDLVFKEFIISNSVRIDVNKNDFDDLGSIFEIGISSNFHLAISFYDEDRIQIKGLIFLTNSDYDVFDNIYFIKPNNDRTLIKLLNKIFFIKIYVFTGKKKNFSVIDIDKMEFSDCLEMNGVITEGKSNINLILDELNKVNEQLISEKDSIEKNKQIIKIKDEKISHMIINFKKEILIQYDKNYNEAFSKINNKVNEMTKKLQVTENNLMNKYKILKDKLKESKQVKMEKMEKPNRIDKANLEIKMKILEDNIIQLKLKINEKDEIIKQLQDNEEKNNKLLKKLREENIYLKSKTKEEKKDITPEIKIDKVEEKKDKKENKKKFDVLCKKDTIDILSSIINSFIIDEEFNDKDLNKLAYLIIHISINPINLFNNFKLSFIYVVKKLIKFILNINNKNLLQLEINNLFNTYVELKKELCNDFTTKEKELEIISSLVTLNYNEKRLNEVIIYKLDYFINYLNKNEKRYEKDLFIRIIHCSANLIQMIFINNHLEIIKKTKNIFSILTKAYEKGEHKQIINFLEKISFFDFFIFYINKNDLGEYDDIYRICIKFFLFLNSLGYNSSVLNYFNEINLTKFIDLECIHNNLEYIIFLSILPNPLPIKFIEKLNDIYQITNNELIKINIECILNKNYI